MGILSYGVVAGLSGALLAGCAAKDDGGGGNGFLVTGGVGGSPGTGRTGTGGGGTAGSSSGTSSEAGSVDEQAAGAGDSGSAGPNDLNSVWKSAGCGMPLPANQVKTIPGSRTGYTEYHVMQTGETLANADPSKAVDRQFFVRVPADYSPDKAYRVVYQLQGCSGSTMEGNTAVYPLFSEKDGGTEQAIYVAVSLPPNKPNNGCYDNRAGVNSQEWEAFQLFQDIVGAKYCVDQNRIFMTGYSSGGWIGNMWGCYFAGIPSPPRKFAPKYALRGRATVTGGLLDGSNPPCNGPMAGMWIHDAGDPENPYSGSVAARTSVLMQDNCGTSPTAPWPGMPDVCVQYTACAKEHPVVFCTTNGQGHDSQQNKAIPGFKKFFDLMNPM